MDKVKVFLAAMKKHHFWVLSGLVVVMGLVGWFLATSQLWADYKANRTLVEREFDELRQITSQERENQVWIDGIDVETGRLKVKVKGAWEDVYAEQRDKVLKWPDILGDQFLALIKSLGPTEEIPVNLRELYYNYIKAEFPRLLKIVDARNYQDKPKTEEMSGPRRRRGVPAGRAKPEEPAEPEQDYKVRWDAQSQEELDRRLDWSDTPTSVQVRFAQEDLWVYQALLTIIANLNDRATGHHNAKVKEIQALEIGRGAAGSFKAGMATGRIFRPEGTKVGPGMPMGEGAPMGAPPTGMTQPPAGMPGALGGKADQALSEGRYVDEKGQPLGADAAAPPEFKRMPVFMRLLIDQREISRLLVECANSPLPVEVRQFRVNPTAAGSNSGARPKANNPYAGGMAMGGGARPGGPRVMGGEGDEDRDNNPYDVIVELHGIIYIFNPPDEAKLVGTPAGDAAAEVPVEGAEAPAGDAAEPAGDEEPADSGGAVAEPAGKEEPADAGKGADEADDNADDEAPADAPADDAKAGQDEAAGGAADEPMDEAAEK